MNVSLKGQNTDFYLCVSARVVKCLTVLFVLCDIHFLLSIWALSVWDKCKVRTLEPKNLNYKCTLRGSELVVTDQERDFVVVVDNSLKMQTQYTTAI